MERTSYVCIIFKNEKKKKKEEDYKRKEYTYQSERGNFAK